MAFFIFDAKSWAFCRQWHTSKVKVDVLEVIGIGAWPNTSLFTFFIPDKARQSQTTAIDHQNVTEIQKVFFILMDKVNPSK